MTGQRQLSGVEAAEQRLESLLLHTRGARGYWEGELSSSALATAVAVVALAEVDRWAHVKAIRAGLEWLAATANPDGGWGDSPESRSNLSTTLLVWSAMAASDGRAVSVERAARGAGRWIAERAGGLEPETLRAAILAVYEEDRTFSAPILLMAALTGRLGAADEGWRLVPQLPLEVAVLPHQLFRWARLPVVSYAIPALIAIGLARHHHRPTANPLARWMRTAVIPSALDRLRRMQPEGGGFLEATPLTGFVVMSLASSGLVGHPVVSAGVDFLRRSQRSDGSWPIDTNLATWVTTLAVGALAAGGRGARALAPAQRESTRRWLLGQQLREEHPFTHSSPGGWAWTDLDGGVPDADDTSGALLALRVLDPASCEVRNAAASGIGWLLDLQNGDGGFPTFCRGWGRLPFDRSCPDITAHALQAIAVWQGELDERLGRRSERAIHRGLAYLARAQRADGAWTPLWFGNQWRIDGANPVYGTAQVVVALEHPELRGRPGTEALIETGRRFLLAVQGGDGGWGMAADEGSTIEETALALSALAEIEPSVPSVSRGVGWLLGRLAAPGPLPAAPIGLYFASLWYDEKLYPIVFSLSALRKLAAGARARQGRGGVVTLSVRAPRADEDPKETARRSA